MKYSVNKSFVFSRLKIKSIIKLFRLEFFKFYLIFENSFLVIFNRFLEKAKLSLNKLTLLNYLPFPFNDSVAVLISGIGFFHSMLICSIVELK